MDSPLHSSFRRETHPNNLGAKDVESFLSHLATEAKFSASTQRQALNALMFHYKQVLNKPIENQIAPIRSKHQVRPPTVLTQAEVHRLLSAMQGKHTLMAKLINIQLLQALLGHADVKTTGNYTHVMARDIRNL